MRLHEVVRLTFLKDIEEVLAMMIIHQLHHTETISMLYDLADTFIYPVQEPSLIY